jgi:hypothetical protein
VAFGTDDSPYGITELNCERVLVCVVGVTLAVDAEEGHDYSFEVVKSSGYFSVGRAIALSIHLSICCNSSSVSAEKVNFAYAYGIDSSSS